MSLLQGGSKGCRYSDGAATSTRSNDVMLLLGPLMAGTSNTLAHATSQINNSNQGQPISNNSLDRATSQIMINHDDRQHTSVICTTSASGISPRNDSAVIYSRSVTYSPVRSTFTTSTAPVTFTTTAPVIFTSTAAATFTSTAPPTFPSTAIVLCSSNDVADTPVAFHPKLTLITEDHQKGDILTQSIVAANALCDDGSDGVGPMLNNVGPVLDLSSQDSHIFASDGITEMVAFELTASEHDSSNSGAFMSVHQVESPDRGGITSSLPPSGESSSFQHEEELSASHLSSSPSGEYIHHSRHHSINTPSTNPLRHSPPTSSSPNSSPSYHVPGSSKRRPLSPSSPPPPDSQGEGLLCSRIPPPSLCSHLAINLYSIVYHLSSVCSYSLLFSMTTLLHAAVHFRYRFRVYFSSTRCTLLRIHV